MCVGGGGGARETLTPQRHDCKPHKQIPPKPNSMEFSSRELLYNWDSKTTLPKPLTGKAGSGGGRGVSFLASVTMPPHFQPLPRASKRPVQGAALGLNPRSSFQMNFSGNKFSFRLHYAVSKSQMDRTWQLGIKISMANSGGG